MRVEMIYHTPDYHKLVEAIARVCYQSYDKLSPTSHNMIKGIMNKGHLSVASVGNIVFTINEFHLVEELCAVLDALVAFKQINNYIRWTTPTHKDNRGRPIVVSMNILTLLDIANNIEDHYIYRAVFEEMLEEVRKVPYLHWFLDDSVEVPPSDSPYIGNPDINNPVILSEDYTALKALGLTDYELDMHATVTVDFITDRATGLQTWRHADMTGGCELSQRYCDRSNSLIRKMVNIHKYPEKLSEYAEREGISYEEATQHYDAVICSLYNKYHDIVTFYADINDTLKELGVSGKRAREIARSILPNAMTTRIIQCRPLKQWKHFFHLRDSVHAQLEIQLDTKAIKNVFEEAGIKYD